MIAANGVCLFSARQVRRVASSPGCVCLNVAQSSFPCINALSASEGVLGRLLLQITAAGASPSRNMGDSAVTNPVKAPNRNKFLLLTNESVADVMFPLQVPADAKGGPSALE